MKHTELQGPRLRKDLALSTARKTYHNRHVDGSGNFGYTLISCLPWKHGRELWWQLHGSYASSGEVEGLRFGLYSDHATVLLAVDTYLGAVDEVKRIMQVQTSNQRAELRTKFVTSTLVDTKNTLVPQEAPS